MLPFTIFKLNFIKFLKIFTKNLKFSRKFYFLNYNFVSNN